VVGHPDHDVEHDLARVPVLVGWLVDGIERQREVVRQLVRITVLPIGVTGRRGFDPDFINHDRRV
jgi:hypothetical protein